MSIFMFLVSIFMTVSYYIKISISDTSELTTIAFYVWILSLFAWLIKVIHDTRVLRRKKEE
ncbi:hypothetical protein PbJCM13498_38250 [Prolixibacter bellariivorans]|uniref:Uncharacterized protein n=3 Tax=Prolixibacter bellariivorans TaxID=314319 RepID=A0A5M4B484_9BACT|nr:hypothetical protein PbJCM13498_38250 [Prolixibacter bellariivorans]